MPAQKKGDSALTRLSPFQNAVIGIAGGCIEVCYGQPMLYAKNASQQGLPLTLNPRVLYRGFVVSVTNMAGLTGIQFPLTGAVTKVITGGADRAVSDGEKVAAGFIGGGLSGLLCGPAELVMVQQQRFGGSLVSTPGLC